MIKVRVLGLWLVTISCRVRVRFNNSHIAQILYCELFGIECDIFGMTPALVK